MFKISGLKKVLILNCVIIICVIIIQGIFIKVEQQRNMKSINRVTINLVEKIVEEYPNIPEEEIISVLNKDVNGKNEVLKKYGFDENEIFIDELNRSSNAFIWISCIGMIFLSGLISLVYFIFIRKKNIRITEISSYLKEVNNRNYSLKIEENGEDELSKLRNELYKTTVLLKEAAENSEREKEHLKNSLADISHQIKTPLTSITILLDNITQNPNMEKKIRDDFIEEINNQIEWINSLVISLLKLAKFDSGVIKMNTREIYAQELISNIISNLTVILNRRKIEITTQIDKDAKFVGDFRWNTEALTNILKNSIEHSKDNSKINIKVSNSSVFLKIEIQDFGEGISKKDQKHIFERFYKSANVQESSIGIGLSLAKKIIEENNGYIQVTSKQNEGTTFEIKYLK
ncbi:MAG: HAMP domain-containing sensor histidine kinase [Clostridia bacterium]|nr:HAMP domain-containing sensor histidine kinase [Clostridia bacterium]